MKGDFKPKIHHSRKSLKRLAFLKFDNQVKELYIGAVPIMSWRS
jgi:hypothetical protein